MEAPEVPLESVQEHLEHHAHAEPGTLVTRIALSTAILATIAAVTSLLAGDHANEAMISQIQSSDQWAFYQAKSIKAAVLNAKTAILEGQGQQPNVKDLEKLGEYAKEQAEIQKTAEEKQHEAESHLRRHKLLASGVTMLQMAIAVGAISALTKKRMFWGVSLLFGIVGIGFLIRELIMA